MPENLENSAVATGLKKGPFSFQSQRKAMPKNVQTTVQLCSLHMLARVCSKSFKLGFSSTWMENFQMFSLDLDKSEEPEIKLPTFVGSCRKQGNYKKKSTCVSLDYTKAFDCVDHNKLWRKFLKRCEYQTTLPVSWETCMWVKKQHLEPDMEQQTNSKLGKEYNKVVYRHPACLIYMQIT